MSISDFIEKQGQLIRFIITYYNIKLTEAFKLIEENRKQTEAFKLRPIS